MSEPQEIGAYKGWKLYFQGISYNCPALKLYGYETERKLRLAVDRECRKIVGKR